MPSHRYEANRAATIRPRPGDPDLDAFDRIAEQVLESGPYPLHLLDRLDEPSRRQVGRLLDRGLLDNGAGEYRITAVGLRRCEEQALRELLAGGTFGSPGRHDPRASPSHGTPDPATTRPYRDGDPLAHLDVGETIRHARQRGRGRVANLRADDLVVMEAEASTRCHTVLLLDRSGSMALYGKFHFAKRLALGLRALLRRCYPEDRLTVVSFGTRAEVLDEAAVLLARPYSVGLLDDRINVRVRKGAGRDDVPEHFTNLQAGFRLARKLLIGQTTENRQILCLTDGEPTAHDEAGDLVLAYPPTEATAAATLREAARCRQAGIALGCFALIDSPLIGQLPAFVDRLAKVGRGSAAYCSAGVSTRLVLDRFRANRRARHHLG